jgi:hypothetical protein
MIYMEATQMELKSIYGLILYSAGVDTIKDLVVAAVKARANLNGANLYRANLNGADLNGANLNGANLNGANLNGADLNGANLNGANLNGAVLYGANLYGANLYRADLNGAVLYGADLNGANLNGANLYRANLNGANLNGADLNGADLNGAKNIPERAAAELNILPEGPIIGWKKCRNNIIVKLLIPAKARKSNASGRKCRAEFVKVIQVFGAEVGISTHDNKTTYRKGETVTCNVWNEDRWVECGGGIHFFISRIEAEKY